MNWFRLFVLRCIMSYWARRDARRDDFRFEERIKHLLRQNLGEEPHTISSYSEFTRDVWKAEDLFALVYPIFTCFVPSLLVYLFLRLRSCLENGENELFVWPCIYLLMILASIQTDVSKNDHDTWPDPLLWRIFGWGMFLALAHFHVKQAESQLSPYRNNDLASTLLFSGLSIVSALFSKISSKTLLFHIVEWSMLGDARRDRARFEPEHEQTTVNQEHGVSYARERLLVTYSLIYAFEKARLAQRT